MTLNSIGADSYYAPAISQMWDRSSTSAETGSTAMQASELPSPSMFSGVDLDESGDLDQSEFETMLDQISEMTGAPLDAEELFSSYDTDQDGVPSEEETLSLMEEGPALPPPASGGPADLADIDNAADQDSDGSISTAEAESLVDMINHASGQDLTAEELVSAFDEDGDGTLSQDETLAALEENRPEMMAGIASYRNGDGLLGSNVISSLASRA